MLKFIIMLVLVMPCENKCETPRIVDCIRSVLDGELYLGSKVGFVSSKHEHYINRSKLHIDEDYSIQITKDLMQLYKGTFLVYSDKEPAISDYYQRKQADLDLVIFYVYFFHKHTFLNLLNIIKSHRVLGPETKVLIIVNKINVHEDLILFILDSCWRYTKSFYSSLVVDQAGTIDFYSYDPFANNKSIVWYKVNTWDNTFVNECHIFPKLPSNFSGYTMRAAYVARPPFTLGRAGPEADPTGSEPKIIKTIASHYNINIEFFEYDERWMVPYENRLFHGIWRLIAHQEVDFAFMATSLYWDRYHIGTPLSPFDMNTACFFVPKTVQKASWRNLVLAFSVEIWLLMLLTYFFIATILFLSKLASKFSYFDALISTARIHLESPAGFTSIKFWPKILLGMFLIYSIIMTSVFKCKVTTLKTVIDKSRGIDSLVEAFDAGYIFYLPPTLRMNLNGSDQDAWSKILTPGRYEVHPNSTYMAFATAVEKKGIFFFGMITGIYLFNYRFGDIGGQSLVSILPNEFTSYSLYIYMSQGHPLYPLFNKKMNALLAAGLPGYWVQHMIDSRRYNPILEDYPSAVTLSELSAIFNLVLILLVVCVVSFVVEVHNEVLRKRFIDWRSHIVEKFKSLKVHVVGSANQSTN